MRTWLGALLGTVTFLLAFPLNAGALSYTFTKIVDTHTQVPVLVDVNFARFFYPTSMNQRRDRGLVSADEC